MSGFSTTSIYPLNCSALLPECPPSSLCQRTGLNFIPLFTPTCYRSSRRISEIHEELPLESSPVFNVFVLGDTRDNTVSSGKKTTVGAQRLKRGISYSVIISQLFNISVLGAKRDSTVSSGEKTTVGAQILNIGSKYNTISKSASVTC